MATTNSPWPMPTFEVRRQMCLRVMVHSSDMDKNLAPWFKSQHYTATQLGTDESVFWTQLGTVGANGYFFLFSHGDETGPNLIDGTDGGALPDATAEKIAGIIKDKKISFYCISCNTGSSNFEKILTKAGCQFVAPLGYASVKYDSMQKKVFIVSKKSQYSDDCT